MDNLQLVSLVTGALLAEDMFGQPSQFDLVDVMAANAAVESELSLDLDLGWEEREAQLKEDRWSPFLMLLEEDMAMEEVAEA